MKLSREEWEEENADHIISNYTDCIEGLCDVPDGFKEALYDQYLEEDEEED